MMQTTARTRGDAIDMHRARAAHAMLAADVRAGRAEFVAQEIAHQVARFAVAAAFAAVQRDGDAAPFVVTMHALRLLFRGVLGCVIHCASSMTRHPSCRTRCRR